MRLAILGLAFVSSVFAQQQWSVGYWTPWTNPACPITAIDMSALTHVVHWAAMVNSDGTLDLDTQRIAADAPLLVSTVHNSNVKALLGISQATWLGKTNTLQDASLSNRAKLVANIMQVVNQYGYDGVDIDWEPFDEYANGVAFHYLASDLRDRLGSSVLTTTAIASAWGFWGDMHEYWTGSPPRIQFRFTHEFFDRVNVMTYDLSGPWDPYSWFQSALYDADGVVWSVDLAVKRFTGVGVPAAKLGIGIPFYGWQWTGAGITGPGQWWLTSVPARVQVGYNVLAPGITPQNYTFDSAAMVPYLSNPNSFITFEDPRSVAAKVSYAKSKGLGGWIMWHLGSDYFPSGSPKNPLLGSVKSAMQ
jgi:chitinase